VNSIRQGLWNIGETSTPRAYLRCVPGIDLDKPPTSFLHFVGEFGEELSPPYVMYRLGQHTSCQPLYVQVFDGHKAVLLRYLAADLVVVIRPLVSDVLVSLLEKLDGLSPAVAALLATGYAPLRDSERRLAMPVVARIPNQSPIGEGGEGAQAHVDADSLIDGGRRRSHNDQAEARVPLPSFSLDRQCLYLTNEWPMHLHL